jgi:The ARF-like 2 binding protein BART
LLRRFVNDRAHIIDLEAISGSEYRLEYTEAYEAYKRLFEEKIEGFIERTLGSSVNDFYTALKSKTEEDADVRMSIYSY